MQRIIRAAIEPRVALTALTTVSCIGACLYLALVLFTVATMEPLYFGLIILMCAIGVSALYILRANQALAIVVYAWLAGICLASMMLHDALRGEPFDHLLWVYPIGVVYLVIYVGSEHAFFYSLGGALLGALLGMCEARFLDGVFYALKPLAVWIVSASILTIWHDKCYEIDCIKEIVRTWERGG